MHSLTHTHTHKFTQPLAVMAHPGWRHLSPSPQTSLPSRIPHPCPLPLRCPGSPPWQFLAGTQQPIRVAVVLRLLAPRPPASLIPSCRLQRKGKSPQAADNVMLLRVIMCYYVLLLYGIKLTQTMGRMALGTSVLIQYSKVH